MRTTSESNGRAIGAALVGRLPDIADLDQRHYLVTSAVVLCAGEARPIEAFVGFARAVVPALQEVPTEAKRLATLAARAALAGYECGTDVDGLIRLGVTGGQWVAFGDIKAAEVWLCNRTTRKGGADGQVPQG
jgi:hypothetical protein